MKSGLRPSAALLEWVAGSSKQFTHTTRALQRSSQHSGHSTYDQVAAYALCTFRDSVWLDPRKPVIFIQHGSAMVGLYLKPIGNHSSVVEFYALLVREPRAQNDLSRSLLQQNYRLQFRALSVDGDGDIALSE